MENLRIESLLKQKQSYLDRLVSEIEAKSKEQDNLSEEIKLLKSKERNLRDEIKKLTFDSSTLIISEHAILRYLERVYGIDIAKIKSEILTENFTAMVKTLGNGIFPVNSIVKAVVTNNVVVTIRNND